MSEKLAKKTLPDQLEIRTLYTALRPVLEDQLHGIYHQLHRLLEKQGDTPTIKYRVKGFNNYLHKLTKLRREEPEKGVLISDLLGLRVICPFLEDLERVEKLICANFEVIELERKGDRHSFREFGYDSVHLLILLDPFTEGPLLPHTDHICEIQLRTILQDAWAEVEHELIYKSDLSFPNDSIKRKLASLNASLSLSDLIFQELRDYQRELRSHGQRRRQSIEDLLNTTAGIEICQSLETPLMEETPATEEQQPMDSPRGLERSMFKALEAHSSKNFAQAIELYGRILHMKLEPQLRSLVYNHRGMAHFAQADYQRAIEDFARAVHYNHDNARAWCNRGLVFRVQGRFDQSLEDYDRAIEIAPGQIEGFWGRAQTCFEMKFFSRALADCQTLLNLQADFSPAQELEKAIRRQMF